MLSFCFQAWSSPPAGLVFLGDEDAILYLFFEKFFLFVVSQKWKIYFWNEEIIQFDFYSTEKLFDWIQIRSETRKPIWVENKKT